VCHWAERALKCAQNNVTWNDGFGAEEGASDHDAQERIPSLKRKLSDWGHVLQPAIVDEDRRRSAMLGYGIGQGGRDIRLAGNVATNIRNRSIGRRLNVPAHGSITKALQKFT
jgi:hypothetical protein